MHHYSVLDDSLGCRIEIATPICAHNGGYTMDIVEMLKSHGIPVRETIVAPFGSVSVQINDDYELIKFNDGGIIVTKYASTVWSGVSIKDAIAYLKAKI